MNYTDLLNWTPESQMLTKENPNPDRFYRYSVDRNMTLEEKREYLREHLEDFAYILDLGAKFQAEKDTIKTEVRYNSVRYKTVFLIAWLKRNDPIEIVDRDYKYGKIRFKYNPKGYSYFNDYGWHIDTIGTPEKEKEFIEQSFSGYLYNLLHSEKQYFLDHDEYTLLKRKWKEENISPNNFGVRISYCSSGEISVISKDGIERPITMDELKELLSLNDQLKEYIAKLTDSCTIK